MKTNRRSCLKEEMEERKEREGRWKRIQMSIEYG